MNLATPMRACSWNVPLTSGARPKRDGAPFAPGVVREYEWVSATSAEDLYFGMTQYESQAAFQSVAMDSAITQGPEAAAFFTSYPPLIAQITTAAP